MNKLKVIKNFNKGFSLVEILVAISIFLVFVIALNTTMSSVTKATRSSFNKERATVLAEEGLEAVRNIRDENFANLIAGAYGLSSDGGTFSFSPTSDVTDIFTRILTIDTINGNQKKVTTTVSWADQTSPTNSVSLSTYLTNWRASLEIGLTINKIVIGGTRGLEDFLPTVLSTTEMDNTQDPPVPVNVDIPISFFPSTMALPSGTYTFLTSNYQDYSLSLSTPCSGNTITLSDGDTKICDIIYTANAIDCTGTPWGTMTDGTSNTAYLTSSVVYPDSCISEIRTCTSGNLSGTYTNTSCAVNPVLATVTTTSPVSSITETSAVGGGNIISNGGVDVTVSGIVWDTTVDPTIALSTKTTDGWAIGGPWTSNITSLTCNTLYHARAYATNSVGTAYGSDVTFTTGACAVLPTVTTPTVASIGTTIATLGANVTSLGLPASISARGTCWGTTSAPTTNCVAEGGTTTGVFTQNRTGFTAGTTYYYRGYAINAAGTAYSEDGTFTTIAQCTVPSAIVGIPTLYNSSGSVSAVVNKPTGVIVGDIMFAQILHNNGTDRLSTIPTGWIQIGRHRNAANNQALYYKVATSTEGASYTFGLSATSKFAVTISAYRGCFNTTNPIDTFSNVEYIVNSTTYRANTISLSNTNTTVLMFPSMYTTAVRTFANPLTQSGGWTEDYDHGATTSDFSRAGYRKLISASGATGNIDSIGQTAVNVKHAFAVALRPL
jgi:prepilin-type N-terminal cleavage/methylation domain-containing protein